MPWAVGKCGPIAARREVSCSASSGERGFFHDQFVLVMFRNMTRNTPVRISRQAKSAFERTAQLVEVGVPPTPERRRHGPIERLGRSIADEAGRPARPYRAVDTLLVMERRGSITPAMRQAGEDFRARFAAARLDPLRAQDWSRPRGGGVPRSGEEPGLRSEAAREAVWRALMAVGGIGSPAGSCLWHVVGWELSLKDWAASQGWSGHRVSQEAASGILIAALGMLAAHFAPGHDC